MAIEYISTDKAAPPAAAYSQAVRANGFVYLSGQVALTPEGKMLEGDIQQQTQQCLNNIKAILDAAGSSVDKVVKVSIFTNDINLFAEVNTVYSKFFNGDKPARTFVAVKALPLNSNVEIEVLALE